MFLLSSCSCLRAICWGQVLSREWRYSWSSFVRWCSNCIWAINNLIAYWGATYIRGLMVYIDGWVRDFGNSSALAMELLQPCTKSTICLYYSDVIMDAMPSRITGVSIVYPTVRPSAHKNIKALRHWALWGEFTGDQWIPLTKGQ